MLRSDHRELRNSQLKFRWVVGGMRSKAETTLLSWAYTLSRANCQLTSFLHRRWNCSPTKARLFRDWPRLSLPALSPLYEVQQRARPVWRRGSRRASSFPGRGGGQHQTHVSWRICLGSMEISMSEKNITRNLQHSIIRLYLYYYLNKSTYM